MHKIHNTLVINGQLIGTLFLSKKNNVFGELLGKVGAHFYPEAHFVPALLEHSNFFIEECTHRIDLEDSEVGISCVQFVAKKVML